MTAAPWFADVVRQDVVRRLLAYRTSAADRVLESHSAPIDDDQLPALIVYTPMEGTDRSGEAALEYEVTLTLHIEARVKGTALAKASKALGLLISEVLDCLLSDPEFVKKFERIPSRNIRTTFPAGSAVELGEADIVLELVYRDRYEPSLKAPFLGVSFDPPATVPAAATPMSMRQDV